MRQRTTSTSERLTPTQRACLRFIHEGKSGGQIAQALTISKSTVESHLAAARRLLGVTTSVQAAAIFHAFELEGRSREPATYAPTYPEALPTSVGEGASKGSPDAPPWWQAFIPLRLPGAEHNDLSIRQRIVGSVVIAFAIAVAFGSFASGVRVVSDLVRSYHFR